MTWLRARQFRTKIRANFGNGGFGELEREFPLRESAIIVPELVKPHWWEQLLYNHRARRLRAALLRYGGPRLVLVSVPWHLEDATPPALADDVAAVESS